MEAAVRARVRWRSRSISCPSGPSPWWGAMTMARTGSNGPGSGRESAVRALAAAGLTVRAIEDHTPLPHNGCRPRKKRRV